MNYHNEIDPFAAQWLTNVIADGLIAPGIVDTRDIRDVRPSDLNGFTQCHFFAGIGGWPLAFRIAGYPENRPVWSGSCPCQPYSAAGKGKGHSDERHLWPYWDFLIEQCRPEVIFGEQVSSAIRFEWVDLVQSDLEAKDYAMWFGVSGSHSIGAPHRRQRLYFCADSDKQSGKRGTGGIFRTQETFCNSGLQYGNKSDRFTNGCEISESSDTQCSGSYPENGNAPVAGSNGPNYGVSERDGNTGVGSDANSGQCEQWNTGQRSISIFDANSSLSVSKLSNANGRISGHGNLQRSGEYGLLSQDGNSSERDDGVVTRSQGFAGNVNNSGKPGWLGESETRSVTASGATRGFWSAADWWYGRDGQYRPIEPGLFPLAHGVSKRVGKLRGYGNSINPWQAAEIIKAYMECRP